MNAAKTAQMVLEIESKMHSCNMTLSEIVRDAFLSIDRAIFVPVALKSHAYKLDNLPIKEQQFISSPLMVAKMCEWLLPQNADSILEIGCGSGYAAAIFSHIFRRVFSIERVCSLLAQAEQRFNALKLKNITIKEDDGQRGWASFAPYSRIILSAALNIESDINKISNLNEILFNNECILKLYSQLENNGIILAPINFNIESNEQKIIRINKLNNDIKNAKIEILESCLFVPILNGIQK